MVALQHEIAREGVQARIGLLAVDLALGMDVARYASARYNSALL